MDWIKTVFHQSRKHKVYSIYVMYHTLNIHRASSLGRQSPLPGGAHLTKSVHAVGLSLLAESPYAAPLRAAAPKKLLPLSQTR